MTSTSAGVGAGQRRWRLPALAAVCMLIGCAPRAWAAQQPQTLQQRVDAAFGRINGYMVPVLFYDVSFGLFEPDAEELRARLERNRALLRREEAKPAKTRDQGLMDRLQREQGKLEAWLKVLDARGRAEQELPALRARLRGLERAGAAGPAAATVAKLQARVSELEQAARARIYSLPLIVVFLFLGAVFFTVRFGFINVRLFGHSIQVIRGKYDNPDDHGEISHFQALTSALSATVGLGNIAGVAIAISQGGAGALFWMWVVAFFGMSSKFSCCTLAQLYRRVGKEGEGSEHVLGGPMVYLDQGIKEMLGTTVGSPLGRILAVLFAFFAIMGSLGGGNLFQGNQTFAIVGDILFHQEVAGEKALAARAAAGDHAAVGELARARAAAAKIKNEQKRRFAWLGGLIMTILVGTVIVGGIKRIGEVTSKMVPAMCLFYVIVCLIIVISHCGRIPALLRDVVLGAFSDRALAWGGIMGVLVVGVKRAAFSNEAGLGSAAIAHSAARTDEPVREGVVAMIGPFIDTIVVCTMTALAILITGAHKTAGAGAFSDEGVGITATAFGSLSTHLTSVLMLAVFVFAYSTMISWSYYGERATEYLFGAAGIWPYRLVFLVFVFISPMISLSNVVGFTDLLILSMAYPNILGMIILSPKVAAMLRDYTGRLRSGRMPPHC